MGEGLQKSGGRVAEVWGKGCRSLGDGGSVIILDLEGEQTGFGVQRAGSMSAQIA